jgi:uncharacterized protein YqeY
MLRSRLETALKEAVLARDEIATSTLRLILAALKDRDISERSKGNSTGLDATEIQGLLQSMVKQRRESIKLYEQGDRPDLVEREAAEITVIETFLPQQLGEDDIATAVAAMIDETEAKSLKDMGRVMAGLRERYLGQMDFSKAGAMVKERLV